LLVGILLTGNRRDLMGRWINSLRSRIWMIITIVLMTIAAVGVVVTSR
jgi:hypothetical protein